VCGERRKSVLEWIRSVREGDGWIGGFQRLPGGEIREERLGVNELERVFGVDWEIVSGTEVLGGRDE
jgi:hypothetical protein